MPGSHCRSAPKMDAIDASAESAKVPNAPGSTTRSLGFIGGPEGSPPAAAYLDRQPGISGRIGEADSAQPTRDGPCHGRLGLWPGLGPHFAAVMRMCGALRTFGLGCTLPRGAAHTFQACNLMRTARVQCTDCIQPCDSELSKCSVRDSPLRLALAAIPGAAAQSREQTTVVLRFDLARSLSCLSDTTADVDDRT